MVTEADSRGMIAEPAAAIEEVRRLQFRSFSEWGFFAANWFILVEEALLAWFYRAECRQRHPHGRQSGAFGIRGGPRGSRKTDSSLR